MDVALPALVLLACPVGMGLMMWFMHKGMKNGVSRRGSPDPSLEDLRSERERLGTAIDELERSERAPGEPVAR